MKATLHGVDYKTLLCLRDVPLVFLIAFQEALGVHRILISTDTMQTNKIAISQSHDVQ